ncbi:MAG TPA: hypothetical protein VJ795_02545 [Rheinheimera sp.]|uniref:hypothetical protein n=1 Tax=Rheinheimera sp. TaxID=1869214 RepID=UPI002B459BC1|nr:hypothetical protein [Rheinheimera sp.]HJS13923.1 hypothetical protein [Rheinheimera sp.]
MISDPEFRKNIIVSVITSIIVLVLIEPILKYASDVLMWMGQNLSNSFTNSLYSSAAMGFREKFSFVALMWLISILIGLVGGATIGMQSAKKRTPISPSSAVGRAINIALAAMFVVLACYMMTRDFIELQLNTSFNQRVTVLAGKAADTEIKEIRADWASMKSRADYEAVTLNMNNIAKRYSIELPEALWE